MQNSIIWPENFTPGYTDNFCSNEVIIDNLDIHNVWLNLITPSLWPTYYSNASDVALKQCDSDMLNLNVSFYFKTFGFPINAQVKEFEAPTATTPGRIAWHGWYKGDEHKNIDVHHAWLIEKLPNNRTRILTQETQLGEAAKELANFKPNPMINGHQDWLEGLVSYSKEHNFNS